MGYTGIMELPPTRRDWDARPRAGARGRMSAWTSGGESDHVALQGWPVAVDVDRAEDADDRHDSEPVEDCNDRDPDEGHGAVDGPAHVVDHVGQCIERDRSHVEDLEHDADVHHPPRKERDSARSERLESDNGCDHRHVGEERHEHERQHDVSRIEQFVVRQCHCDDLP